MNTGCSNKKLLWYAFINLFRRGLDFSGRTSREESNLSLLANLILTPIILWIGIIYAKLDNMPTRVFVPWIIYTLAMFVPMLALLIRRLHDTGRSGWIILNLFIPAALLSLCWLVAWILKEGDVISVQNSTLRVAFLFLIVVGSIVYDVLFCKIILFEKGQVGFNLYGPAPIDVKIGNVRPYVITFLMELILNAFFWWIAICIWH